MAPRGKHSGGGGGGHQANIAEIVLVFVACTVGLALTPSIITSVAAATGFSGAALTLLNLIPLFWIIFLMAIPIISVTFYIKGKMSGGGKIGISEIVAVFLPMVVGLALSPSVASTVTTTLASLNNTTAAYTMLSLFPLFWVIYLISIPVSAIAVYFYTKMR